MVTFSANGVTVGDPVAVIGLDLSLTAPGVAAVRSHDGGVTAFATAVSGVPSGEDRRGLTLANSANRIASAVVQLGGGGPVIAVLEAILTQSLTGKAAERAALWWMVRAELEARRIPVTSLHPTTRKSLGLDAQGAALLRGMERKERSRSSKRVGLASMRRRWPLVIIPDDNAADALVCADLGARALGFEGMPDLENKNLSKAIQALGITKGN